MKTIDSFRGSYRFLSNFYLCTILDDGIYYPSVEHAFQAAKTIDRAVKQRIASIAKPGEAKRAGRQVELRPDWDAIKVNVMYGLLRKKFADPTLRRLLVETDDAELIEGNEWEDRFWGMCRGFGDNHLGKLLMQVRTEITGKK